jgi:hypothetical protein
MTRNETDSSDNAAAVARATDFYELMKEKLADYVATLRSQRSSPFRLASIKISSCDYPKNICQSGTNRTIRLILLSFPGSLTASTGKVW